MAIIYAEACELPLPTTTSTEGLIIPSSGASFAIGDRVTTWADDIQGYSYRAVVDSAGEGGVLTPTQRTGAPSLAASITSGKVFIQDKIAFTDATPALISNACGVLSGGDLYTFRLGTDGTMRLYDNAGAPAQVAAGTRVLVDNTAYWRLVEIDLDADTIKLYLSTVAAGGGLTAASDWTTPDLTLASAGMAASFQLFQHGFACVGKTNPASTMYTDQIVWRTDQPTQPAFVWYLNADANGNYSGGSTNWLTEAAGAGDIASVDDPISANSDGDTTYNECPRVSADPSPISMNCESCATAGIPSTDTVLAVMPVNRIGRQNAASDTTALRAGLRQNSTDTYGLNGPPNTTGGYRQPWEIFETAPDASAWTQAKVDSCESLIKKIGTSSGGTATWRVTRMGLYVVTEAAVVAAGTARSYGAIL